jgi:asparagine synthase (glutamine-hydrolysing)
MCGIWAYIKKTESNIAVPNLHDVVKVRGPDSTNIFSTTNCHLVFHRLAIHDLTPAGDQPFIVELGGGRWFVYMCNGEIYNYDQIMKGLLYETTPKSSSDCEVIGHLFKLFSEDFEKVVKVLDGEFAIVGVVLKRSEIEKVVAARDPYGVRPLYWASTKDIIVYSSLLAGVPVGVKAYHFPPGYYSDNNTLKRFFVPQIRSLPTNHAILVNAVVRSISKRMSADRPMGFLLSGGLDSSLVVAVASRILKIPNIRTFSIGMPGGTDLKYAQMVSEFLGTDHTEVTFSQLDGVMTLNNAIKATETYDITTIRASTGQYLLAKYISQNTNIKVILNGDGADEAQMGYLYNYFHPNHEAAHADSLRLLDEIHCFDGLRVDRCLGYHGLEARVPFLDPDFVSACLSIPVEQRVPTPERMEKHFIREAFSMIHPAILPPEVLWRKKEAFSDGVSKLEDSWSNIIRRYLSSQRVVPKMHVQPTTPEAAYYREIFDQNFPGQAHIVPHYWLPKWTNATDPSARTLKLPENNQ